MFNRDNWINGPPGSVNIDAVPSLGGRSRLIFS